MSSTDSASNQYSYDSEGNRTNSGYVTGTGNRVLSDGTFTYGYDASGNRTSKTSIATGQTWTYAYDLLNHLTSVEERTSSGALVSRVEYTYDVFGNRLSRTEYDSALDAVSAEYYAYDMWKTTLDAPKSLHFPTKAKRVIFLLMHGGVSHAHPLRPLVSAGGALRPFRG